MDVSFEVTVAVIVLLLEGHTAYLVCIVQRDELGTAVNYFNLLVLLFIGLHFLIDVVSPWPVAKIEDTLCLFVLIIDHFVLFLRFQRNHEDKR